MEIILIQALGAFLFFAGSVVLGMIIRRRRDRETAEKTSRISHLLFWAGLATPGAAGFIYPGLSGYDSALGFPGLPVRPVWSGVGVMLILTGFVFLVSSNRSLAKTGRGAAAFMLTERLVTDGPYARTRNPMSLGYYAVCTGIGMIAGSLSVTLGVLLIIIPIHILNLKIFEERELELRYGDPFIEYKNRVPFLLPRLTPLRGSRK